MTKKEKTDIFEAEEKPKEEVVNEQPSRSKPKEKYPGLQYTDEDNFEGPLP
jgi:hypothetical protein